MDRVSEQNRIARTLFASLVIVFGLQSMRFLFGSLSWYLRDTLGIGVLDLIPIAFAPFLLAGLIPLLVKWIPFQPVLLSATLLLVVARLVNQVATDPMVDFWASSVATLAFVGLLPLLFGLGRTAMVGGVLVGLAIDSAIKGLGLSLDLAYQPGWRSVVAVLALGLGIGWAYNNMGALTKAGASPVASISLLGLAPFLFIQMLFLQSQGWTSAVTGVSGPTAQLRIALLNVIAVFLAYRLAGNRTVFAACLGLVLIAVLAAEGDATAYNVLSLLAVPAAGVVWAGLVPEPDGTRLGASSFYLIAGASLFLGFGLAYYVPLDMNLGFDAPAVRIAAGVSLAALGAVAMTRGHSVFAKGENDWVFAAAAALLPVLAFIGALGVDSVGTEGAQEPIRFVSYNVHSAFDVDGNLDVAGIAEVIADTRADVVGLQEVPRGQLLSANTDLLTLLQLELGFEHVAFFGTTDPVWGNAILSRYPIINVGTEYLPRVGTPMRRGYLGALVEAGERQILVISTHLQHVNDSDVHDEDPEADLLPVHTEQISVILEEWGSQTPAVLMGDFNARPEWEQIGMITSAGWVDTWAEAGSGDGFTSNAADPQYRIDYIFHTSDIRATDVGVFQSTASDHFAVVADLSFE
jgi:endonuclease/exonuclease/phosphatase family metal-dependent hydrolase